MTREAGADPVTPRPPPGDLLARVTQGSLDDDYAAAAGRPPASRARTAVAVGGGLALLALLLTVAAVEARADATQSEEDREALIDRISAEQEDVGSLRDEVEALEQEVDQLRADALRGADEVAALDEVLARLEASTGTVPVTGPGLRILLDDAPSGSAEGTIQDTDLQLCVNGLWEAGAEAVAVGGQRLTTRSAIRTAGQAITVNYRSLSPPYVVTAIGDPATLAADFLDTAGGQATADLSANFGTRFEVTAPESVTLPGRLVSVDQAQQTQDLP